MKGKRYTTEQKIRILREAESSDKTILDVCRERQISEQTFHRWKRGMGMLEVDQALFRNRFIIDRICVSSNCSASCRSFVT